MKVPSDIVGLPLKPHQTEITWRHTTNYAAAIGDMNPCYIDDCREEGIIAHPMFAVALSWPIIQNVYEYVKLPFPPEAFQTIVHYTEHLEFIRPVRPADRLTLHGRVAAVVPEKSGTHVVFQFIAVDEENKPVYTEYAGGMLRGVYCDGPARRLEEYVEMPRRSETDGCCWQDYIPIKQEAPYIYDGCSNIIFGIHTSPKFAKQVGLPGIILQGTATLALAVSHLINRELGGDSSQARSIAARFTGMVFPGTEIAVRLLSRDINNEEKVLHFEVQNHLGQKAIRDGCITMRS